MIYYSVGVEGGTVNSLKIKLPSKQFSYFMAALGGLLYAIGAKLFIVPLGFYNGGAVGIAQLIRTGLENGLGMQFGSVDIAGIIYYAINVPLFLWAFKDIGKEFIFKTAISVTVITLGLTFIPAPIDPIIDDSLAGCLIGGIISGVGTGIALKYGASGGGGDIVGIILSKRIASMTVGKVSIGINLLVYGTMLFLFDPSIAIYSIIYTVFMNMTIDKVHAQVINVEVQIFTKKDSKELEKHIFDRLYRGATTWEAKGGYTDEPGTMIYMIINKYELPLVKSIVLDYDEHAFVTYKEHVSVIGNFIKRL